MKYEWSKSCKTINNQLFSFRLTVFYCKPDYVHLDDGLNILLESSYLSYYWKQPILEDDENSIVTYQCLLADIAKS